MYCTIHVESKSAVYTLSVLPEVVKIFQAFDHDGNGLISVDEVRRDEGVPFLCMVPSKSVTKILFDTI